MRFSMPRCVAPEVFDLILEFAGYGFPKAHATAYALITYQTPISRAWAMWRASLSWFADSIVSSAAMTMGASTSRVSIGSRGNPQPRCIVESSYGVPVSVHSLRAAGAARVASPKAAGAPLQQRWTFRPVPR